ncbi:MAG: hypothetical protein ACKJSG_16265 [Lentisphaeria bacterium]
MERLKTTFRTTARRGLITRACGVSIPGSGTGYRVPGGRGQMLDNTSQVFRNPFFYHKAVMLSDYRAPSTVLEYISASGGKIFGLLRHLTLSNNIDILQYTDDPYSWDLEIRRRRD